MEWYSSDRFFENRDFRFHIGRSMLERPFPEHSHEFTELFVILSGKAEHTVAEQGYPIVAGDVFVIHRPEFHAFRSPQHLEIVNIMYDPASLPLPVAYLGRIPGYHALFSLEPKFRREHGFAGRLHLRGRALDSVRVKLDAMEKAYLSRRVGYEAELIAAYVDLTIYLAREYQSNPSPSAADLMCVAGALGLMEREYHRRIGLDELAQEAGLSRNHFLRVFRRATGRSPIDYLLGVRTARAAVMLRETRLSVTEIALENGFSDGNYFSRIFRRTHGMSPTAYRR